MPYGRQDNCNDLLSYIIPTQIFFLKNHGTIKLVSKFYQLAIGESASYLSLPLILIAVIFFIKQYRHRYEKFMLTLASIFAFLSLGQVLHIAGIKIMTLLPNKIFSIPL